jgi:hypothetical protein
MNLLVSIAALYVKIQLRLDPDGPHEFHLDLGELRLHLEQEFLHGGDVGGLPFVPRGKAADLQTAKQELLLIPSL